VMKSRRMRWAGHVAHIGERRSYTGFGGETWGKGITWETQAYMEDNIKMDLQIVGWGERTGLIWLGIGTGGGLLWVR
jgi:hypothetical protein